MVTIVDNCVRLLEALGGYLMSYYKTFTYSNFILFFIMLAAFPAATPMAQDTGNAAANQGLLEEIIVTGIWSLPYLRTGRLCSFHPKTHWR